MLNNCICGSGKAFSECCEPLLSGKMPAKTPEQLMRSRYSAYAFGGYGDYLLKTWFAPMAKGLTAQALSEKAQQWVSLEVCQFSLDTLNLCSCRLLISILHVHHKTCKILVPC